MPDISRPRITEADVERLAQRANAYKVGTLDQRMATPRWMTAEAQLREQQAADQAAFRARDLRCPHCGDGEVSLKPGDRLVCYICEYTGPIR